MSLGGQRRPYVEMLRFDIAPVPFVGLVPDAEIVDRKAILARGRNVLEEKKIARAENLQFVIRDRGEIADHPAAADA